MCVRVCAGEQQHHAFSGTVASHTPCLLRLVQLAGLDAKNSPSVNEWAVHVLYNMAENSSDLAVRLTSTCSLPTHSPIQV